MNGFTVRYSFRQRFAIEAARAYAWCTDYRPDDHDLTGEGGRRRISWISGDALILWDTFPRPGGGSVTKVKLVRLDPKGLTWTNTHIGGPARHSQFLYRIVSEGRNRSRLEFSGFQHERDRRRPSPARTRALASRLRREDSSEWKLLAKAMERDLLA